MRWGFHMVIQGDDKQREKVIQSKWYIGHMWNKKRGWKKTLDFRGRGGEGAERSLLWFIQGFRACVSENKISSVDHITLHPLQIFIQGCDWTRSGKYIYIIVLQFVFSYFILHFRRKYLTSYFVIFIICVCVCVCCGGLHFFPINSYLFINNLDTYKYEYWYLSRKVY